MASPLCLSNFVSFLSCSFSSSPPPHLSVFPSSFSSSSRRRPGELASVVYPSIGHSNTVCFNSSYNVQVIVEENESGDRMLGRFRREVMRAGVFQEVRRRRYFENTQEAKKRKSREAAKRNRFSRRPFTKFTNMNDNPPEAEVKKVEDDGDNWELPAGGIPY